MKRNRLHSEWKEKPPKRDDTGELDNLIASIRQTSKALETMEPESVMELYMRYLHIGTATINE